MAPREAAESVVHSDFSKSSISSVDRRIEPSQCVRRRSVRDGGLSAGRLAGMGVIYEVLRGLVLRRRVRRPFGDAEQQARATDISDG